MAASAYAQDWPLPAATPNTDVLCAGCLNGKDGLKTIGYPPTLRFVGRFVDSETTKEIQFNFRTVRARGVGFLESADPAKSRIYMMMGSAPAAYNTDTFFSREAAHETLYPATAIPTRPSNSRSGANGPNNELFLEWDRFFYAENGGGWNLGGGDGQDRLYGVDWDDRGYVYLAYSAYGWGIVKDDFGTGGDWMPSIYQHVGDATDVTPISIVLVKADGDYYVVVTSGNDKAQVWKVTNPASPEKRSDLPGRAFNSYAKDATGSRVATVDGNGRLQVLTASAFVNGGTPIISRLLSGGQYKSIGSDGTNFYALSSIAGSSYVSVIDGTTYAETEVPILNSNSGGHTNFSTPGGIRAGGGYLAAWGIEDAVGGWNIHLYKIGTGGSLTEVPLNNYFAQYYSGGAPTGYVHPTFSAFMDIAPYKRNGKSYLIVESFGLGDVYEIRAGDSLTAHLTSTPTPFYGDRQTFTSSTASNNPMAVTWDFGDGTQGSTLAGSPTITHQFGGATAPDLPLTRRVTVTSQTDPSLTDSLTVTLAKPTAGFKVAATGYLFRLPDASSVAQIVTSDSFADISDGNTEGHYTQWTLDQTTTKTLPSATTPVGGCGPHTLKFVAHYGPYDPSTFAAASDAQFAIDSVTYTGRPFAVSVQVPPAITPPPAAVTFSASIRPSLLPADLPNGANTACTYEWALVDASNANKQVLAGGTGSSTLGSIPQSPAVSTSVFAPLGKKILLTVTVNATAVSSTCNSGGFAAQSTATDLLRGPDPTIVVTGCAHIGDPCKLTVTSTGSQSGWTYDWSTAGTASCPHCGAFADFSPVFTQVGTYTATLVAANGIGSATALSAPISVGAALCGTPDANSSAIGFSGATSGCFSSLDTCSAGETITFRVSTFGWVLGECNTYQWDFGDGARSTAAQPTHAYSTNGQYTVTLNLTGGLTTIALTTTVKIGSIIQPPPPPPPPPPPGSCATLTADAAYVGFIGNTSGCTSNFGTCNPAESILFTLYAYGSYNFACPSSNFQWSFSDGGGGNGQSTSHTFGTPGTYTASCTVSNSGGTQTYTVTVQAGSSVPRTCGTMTQANAAVTYSGINCSDAGGDCQATKNVVFAVVGKGSAPYDFTCATHTYSWTFGDGGSGAGATPTHVYQSAGTYTATVTITQGNQNIQYSHAVSVGGSIGGTGSCQTMYPDSNVYISFNGTTSQCPFGASGACKVGESVSFVANELGYDYGCDTHTYSWDFGDGGHSTSQNPTHVYEGDGTYKVTLHLANRTQAVDLGATVKVGTGVSVPPRHRPARH
jgi:PKD repeat protein